jgi:hypothetical protein
MCVLQDVVSVMTVMFGAFCLYGLGYVYVLYRRGYYIYPVFF